MVLPKEAHLICLLKQIGCFKIMQYFNNSTLIFYTSWNSLVPHHQFTLQNLQKQANCFRKRPGKVTECNISCFLQGSVGLCLENCSISWWGKVAKIGKGLFSLNCQLICVKIFDSVNQSWSVLSRVQAWARWCWRPAAVHIAGPPPLFVNDVV